MADRLRYDRRFKRSLQALPGDIRGLARSMIAQLAEDPHPSQAKELDDHPTYYRLWLPHPPADGQAARENRVWNAYT